MAIITKFNAYRIIRNSNLMKTDFQGNIYKYEIHFLNRLEKKELLAYKEFMKNPEKYFSHLYIPLDLSDKKKYVLEEENRKPAYHSDEECKLLHGEFKDVILPKEIKQKGNQAITEFREWFKTEMIDFFYAEKYELIILSIKSKYGITVQKSDFVKFANGDHFEISNYDLSSIEQEIDRRVALAGKYYNENKHILKVFSLRTFLAYKKDEIPENETGMLDKDLKTFLKDYDEQYKKPVKRLLQEYFTLMYNPDFQFQGNLLDSLNFKQCNCYNADEKINPHKPTAIDRLTEGPELGMRKQNHADKKYVSMFLRKSY